MELIQIPLQQIKPYKRNAKRHSQKQIANVAESIKKYGFVQPLVIGRNMEIVIGHCRYEAAKKLGLQDGPCVLADKLSGGEVKALRLIDNKLNESEWDNELLNVELGALDALDFGDICIDWDIASDQEPDEDDSGYYGDAREKTVNVYNLHAYDASRVSGFYQMPVLRRVNHIPKNIIGFNYVLTAKNTDAGVHFYLDDYQFERIWNSPQKYIARLKAFDCVFTPDFSLYADMPMSMKVWNIYRSRLIGQMMQDAGITVIPTLSWAEKETFGFCFDGLEQGGSVTVSTIGVKREKAARKIWTDGMDAAMERLRPKTVLVYGGDIGYDFGSAEAVYFENTVTERMAGNGR